MTKYSKAAHDKISHVVEEYEKGELKSGRSGQKVTSRKQAVAIGIDEARRSGLKVPKQSD